MLKSKPSCSKSSQALIIGSLTIDQLTIISQHMHIGVGKQKPQGQPGHFQARQQLQARRNKAIFHTFNQAFVLFTRVFYAQTNSQKTKTIFLLSFSQFFSLFFHFFFFFLSSTFPSHQFFYWILSPTGFSARQTGPSMDGLDVPCPTPMLAILLTRLVQQINRRPVLYDLCRHIFNAEHSMWCLFLPASSMEIH